MATWADGPEYAPRVRPQAFVIPDAEPLAPVQTLAPAPAYPEAEPHFDPPSGDAPELAALVPSLAPGRNPNVPFEVVTAAVTAPSPSQSGGASGGASTGRSPYEPFGPPGPSLKGYLPVHPTVDPTAQVNPAPFPAPGTQQWFAPPPPQQAPAAPPAVTVGQIFTAITPAVLITFAVGALFSWLSLFMLALAFTLSARIAYRRESVRRAFSVAFIILGAFGVVSLLSDGWNADVLFDSLAGGAQLACWLLPLVVFLIVGSALRAGERPDRTG